MKKTEYFQATDISNNVVAALAAGDYVVKENYIPIITRSFCKAVNRLFDDEGHTSITITDDKNVPIVRIHKTNPNPIGFFLTESSNVISELPKLNGKDLVISENEDGNDLANFKDIFGKICNLKFASTDTMILIYRLIFTEMYNWIKENPETNLDLFCTFVIEKDSYFDVEYEDLEDHMNAYLKFSSDLKN